MRSNTSHEELFPTFYRRGGTSDGGRSQPAPSASINLGEKIRNEDLHGRVVYAPMAEKKKLGYFSTAALIIR